MKAHGRDEGAWPGPPIERAGCMPGWRCVEAIPPRHRRGGAGEGAGSSAANRTTQRQGSARRRARGIVTIAPRRPHLYGQRPMSIRLLVLHGPNVPLRLEKEASLTLTALHRDLKARAKELGATLRTATVHGEEGLLAALYEQRGWANGVLLASGHLAGVKVIVEALALLGVPHVELSSSARGAAHALDAGSYLDGLEALVEQVDATASGGSGKAAAKSGTATKSATPRTVKGAATRAPASGGRAKTLGRKLASAAGDAGASSEAAPSRSRTATKTLGRKRDDAPAPAKGPIKTLGRKPRSTSGEATGSPTKAVSTRGMPTRDAARAQLAARLSGSLDASGLQAWAREGWAKLEAAQSPDARLSAVLLRLTAGKDLSDDRLISLMTELDR